MARLQMRQGTLLMNWIEANEDLTRHKPAENWLAQAEEAMGFPLTAAHCRDRQRAIGFMKKRPVKPKAPTDTVAADVRAIAAALSRLRGVFPAADIALFARIAGIETPATAPMFLPPPKMWPQANE